MGQIGREIGHSFPKSSKIVLKVEIKILAIEYRSTCGGCANDNTLRSQSLSWFARKPWEQGVIQRHLQLILLHICDLVSDSKSMGSTYT